MDGCGTRYRKASVCTISQGPAPDYLREHQSSPTKTPRRLKSTGCMLPKPMFQFIVRYTPCACQAFMASICEPSDWGKRGKGTLDYLLYSNTQHACLYNLSYNITLLRIVVYSVPPYGWFLLPTSNITKLSLPSPLFLVSLAPPHQAFASSAPSDASLALIADAEQSFSQPRQPIISELCVYVSNRDACSATHAST